MTYIIGLHIKDPLCLSGIQEALTALPDFRVAGTEDEPDFWLTDIKIAQGKNCPPDHVVGPENFTAPVIKITDAKPARLGSILAEGLKSVLTSQNHDTDKIVLGPYILNTHQKYIMPPAGDRIGMTDLEVAILAYFAARPGQPVDKQTLLKDVWGYQEGVTTHTVETHIYRLRQKISGFDVYFVTAENGYILTL